MFSTYSSRVAELLQKIESGEIALPDLQRPFVWEDAKVRNLLDSMNKGFPVGYVMLWDFPDDYDAKPRSSAIAKSGTRSVRSLLIDGQQRLTALLSAMDGIVVKDKDYRDRRIRISFNPLAKADDGKQIGQFEVYQPNRVMIWTDTFANNRQSSIFSTTLGENNARLVELNRQDIRVIIGNPPYSVGQDNANDDNQNEHYDELDDRIAKTYAAKTEAVNKNSLYDSYIRAYRWASDRIGNKGIIGFVTNAGWIDSNSADGMRKCLTEEFSSIYVYHLKGNQRTSGERSRQEGGKVFGEGSRAPVAIVFLVKNPASTERGKIFFHSVDDYLTREEKLACLREDRSMAYTYAAYNEGKADLTAKLAGKPDTSGSLKDKVGEFGLGLVHSF